MIPPAASAMVSVTDPRRIRSPGESETNPGRFGEAIDLSKSKYSQVVRVDNHKTKSKKMPQSHAPVRS